MQTETTKPSFWGHSTQKERGISDSYKRAKVGRQAIQKVPQLLPVYAILQSILGVLRVLGSASARRMKVLSTASVRSMRSTASTQYCENTQYENTQDCEYSHFESTQHCKCSKYENTQYREYSVLQVLSTASTRSTGILSTASTRSMSTNGQSTIIIGSIPRAEHQNAG